MLFLPRINLLALVALTLTALWIPHTAPAAAPDRAPGQGDALVLGPSQEIYYLGRHAAILEDPEGKLSFAQAAAPERADLYRPLTRDTLNLGITSSTYWMRFTLYFSAMPKDAPRGAPRNPFWVLMPGAPLPDRTSWAIYDHTGRIDPQPAFQLGEPPVFKLFNRGKPGPHTYYLRMDSSTALLLEPRVALARVYLFESRRRSLALGLYYGITLAVVLYNFFIFLALRDRNYLWYLLNILFLALYFAGSNGVFYQYFLAVTPEMMGEINRTILGVAMVFTGFFVRSFLRTRRYSAWLDRLVVAYMGLTAICLATGFILPARLTNIFYSLLGVMVPLVTIAAGVTAWRQGYRPARFFLLAWGFLALGALLFALTFAGVIPYFSWSFFSFQTGSAVAAVLLSFALADRIRLLRQEKIWAQAAEKAKGEIIEFLPDATFVIDRAGKVTAWNRAMEELTGITAAEMIGRGDYAYAVPFYQEPRPMLIDLVINPDPEMAKRYLNILQDGDLMYSQSEHPLFGPQGETHYMWGTARPLYDQQGEVAGAIETIRDVTALRQAEMERLAKERLQSAVQTAGAACHELNQPLQSVMAQLELALMRLGEDDPLKSTLKRLWDDAQKMGEITQRLNRITDYRTRTYLGREEILDLHGSSDDDKEQPDWDQEAAAAAKARS